MNALNKKSLAVTYSTDTNLEEDLIDPIEILKKLIDSKVNGNLIGITSPLLSRIMVVTGVEDIVLDDSPIVVLKPYDKSGCMLLETKIPLSEIYSVRPFTSKFENPFLQKLGDEKAVMFASSRLDGFGK